MLGTPISSARGIGFNYDQQAEPAGVTTGQLWRERTAGGLIVGEWEWTGTLWASLRFEWFAGGQVTNIAASQNPNLNGNIATGTKTALAEMRVRAYCDTADLTNNWLVDLRTTVETATSVNTSEPLASSRIRIESSLSAWREVVSAAFVIPAFSIVTSARIIRTGAPANLTAYVYGYLRRIR